MRPESEEQFAGDSESEDLVARARAAVAEMRKKAAAGGLDASSEPGAPEDAAGPAGEDAEEGDLPAPKPRRRRKGAGRAA